MSETENVEKPPSLLDTLKVNTVERFKTTPSMKEDGDPYFLRDAAEEEIAKYAKESGKNIFEIAGLIATHTTTVPDDSKFVTIVEGAEYDSWDQVFRDFAASAIEAELYEKYTSELYREDSRRFDAEVESKLGK